MLEATFVAKAVYSVAVCERLQLPGNNDGL